ncbi:MAG: LPXTG cell wall anchor domain-containing protein [Coprobacillaceae bacterium]
MTPDPAIEKGYGMFAGLEVDKDNAVKYYLVETKAPQAPNGVNWEYVLHPIIEVTIEAGTTSKTVKVVNTRTGEDGPGPIFKLPETGGTGTALFIIVGLGLIGASTYALLKTKKKEEHKK